MISGGISGVHMGRSGRDRTSEKKMMVESCVALDTGILKLRPGTLSSGVLSWGDSSMGYGINTMDPSNSWLNLYTVSATGEAIDCRNQLVTTCLPSGGLRWWFICPLVTDDRSCRARVKKLYLPPGGRYFGCRTCYGLTYTSCQTHN